MPQSAPVKDLYRLQKSHRIHLRIHYPTNLDNIILRTDLDWNRDVLPSSIDRDQSFVEFQFETSQPFVYVKPCVRPSTGLLWAIGPNNLVVATRDEVRDGFPNFYSSSEGSVLDVITLDSKILNRQHRLRVYLPAGYAENTLRSFPVMYMQDGGNLFFSEEAFMGQDWGVRDKLALLDKMNAIQQMIIVGVHSADRIMEYTQPGYEAYGRSVVEEVKPYIDAHFRTRSGSQHTGVMGSSLGGVVSFYMAWQWPEIFGNAGCLSSTFTHKDNLVERVLQEEPRDVRFYLDSGWPGDNYEVGLAMAMALAERGYRYGLDFMYFAFPNAKHSENDWGQRLHVPFQFFAGRPAVVSRLKHIAMASLTQSGITRY